MPGAISLKREHPEINSFQKAPSKLVLRITSECNLHCRFCHIWMNSDDRDRLLPTEDMLEAVRQFSEISPEGTVVLAGGELLLRKDLFYEISSLCRTLNVRSYAVTNGSLVSEDECLQLLRKGPKILVFSLDSHDPEIHDWARGTKGSFEAIRRTVEGIVDIRRRNTEFDDIEIYFNSILFDRNIHMAEEFLQFARDIGADGVKFQCLQPTLSNQSSSGGDSFFDKYFFQDKSAALAVLDELIGKYKLGSNDRFLLNSRIDLEWMKSYVRIEGRESEEPVCDSFNDIVYMDQYGDYALCPSMEELDNVGFIGNFKDVDLKSFWQGQEAGRAREVMGLCTKSCGMMDCYRKGTTSI